MSDPPPWNLAPIQLATEEHQEKRRPLPVDSVFVCLLVGVGFLFYLSTIWIREHTYPLPSHDFSDFLPYIIGEKPITLTWLWEPFREHRSFLPKLWYCLVASPTHGQDVWVVWINSFWMLAASLVSLWGARRIRGRSSFFDILFPLILLTPTLCITIWIFGVYGGYCLTTMLLVSAGTLLLSWPISASRLRVVAFSFCIIGLPLCDIGLLIANLPLVVAAFYLGAVSWNQPRLVRSRLDAGILWGAALLTVMLSIAYFIGFDNLFVPNATSLGVGPALLCCVILFGTSLRGFDYSLEGMGIVPLGIMCLFLLGGIYLSVRNLFQANQEKRRQAVLAFLAFLASGLYVGVVGWGRNSQGIGNMVSPHYPIIAMPAQILLLLMFIKYADRRVQIVVLAVSCGLLIGERLTERPRTVAMKMERDECYNDLRRYRLADSVRNHRCFSFIPMSDEDFDKAIPYRLGMLSTLNPLYFFDDLPLLRQCDGNSWPESPMLQCDTSRVRIDPVDRTLWYYMEDNNAVFQCNDVPIPDGSIPVVKIVLKSSVTGRRFQTYYYAPESLLCLPMPNGNFSCNMLLTYPLSLIH